MSGVTSWLLTGVINYGPPLLGLVVFIGSLGIPFPVTLLVVAAGAFAREGLLDWRVVLPIGALAAVLADSSEFLLGRLAESWVERRFGRVPGWSKVQEIYDRRGALTVVLTRFWLTPLAPLVNLTASSRFTYRRFLLVDGLGEILWVLLYAGLGYLFGGEWEAVSQFISDFSGLSVGLVVLAAGIYIWRRTHPRR